MKKTTFLQRCESCDKKTDFNTMKTDADDNYFCQPCWNELAPVMKDEYDEMVVNGEIEPND